MTIKSAFLLFLICIYSYFTYAQKSFLALGDSYTIGESVAESMRWPEQLVSQLNENGHQFKKPTIIARTGWRTDQLSEAIENTTLTPPYDLVGLLIGVNNQYQGKSIEVYQKDFEELLKMAITLAGNDKNRVFVVSIPDYGFTPFGAAKREKISRELDDFNAINKSIALQYQVAYFNITDISRSDVKGLVAEDNLHPSGEQYRLWVNKMIESEYFTNFK